MKARVNGVLRQRKDPASLTSCLEKIWKLERETTGFHVKNHARAIHEATQFRFHRIHFSQFSCLGEKHRRGRTRSTPKLWPICCRKTLTSINIALIKPPCRNLTAHMHIHRGDATSLCICCSERDELRADRMKLFDRFSLWQSLLYNLVWVSPPKNQTLLQNCNLFASPRIHIWAIKLKFPEIKLCLLSNVLVQFCKKQPSCCVPL